MQVSSCRLQAGSSCFFPAQQSGQGTIRGDSLPQDASSSFICYSVGQDTHFLNPEELAPESAFDTLKKGARVASVYRQDEATQECGGGVFFGPSISAKIVQIAVFADTGGVLAVLTSSD